MESDDRLGRLETEKMSRVFVGVPVEGALRLKMAKWKDLQKDMRGVRWVRSRCLHATLLAPWYVKTTLEKDLCKGISKIDVTQFSVEFTLVTLGPQLRHPWLVWAKSVRYDKVNLLFNSVTRLFDQPYPRERRELHVTLGRLTSLGRKNQMNLVRPHVRWHLPVTSVVLYRSALKAKGAEYTELKRIPLLTHSY